MIFERCLYPSDLDCKQTNEPRNKDCNNSQPVEYKTVTIKAPINVRDLANSLKQKPFIIISDLMRLGGFVMINQTIDEDMARLISAKYGFRLQIKERRHANLEAVYIVHSHIVIRDDSGEFVASYPAEMFRDLPRVAELFEARRPKDAAEISKIDGLVDLSGKRTILIKDTATGAEQMHLIPFGKHGIVFKGDLVKKGQQLTEGPMDPHKILEVLGPQELQEYLVSEVQQAFRLYGVTINDKHVRIIVRQMLRKVRITEPGDTTFLWGEQVDKMEFEGENERVEKIGGKPAEASPVLLGITKASFETDSFLSAASFLDTAPVLTQAATCFKVDSLRSIKETVIMGHIIPDTGFDHNRKVILKPLEEIPDESEAAFAEKDTKQSEDCWRIYSESTRYERRESNASVEQMIERIRQNSQRFSEALESMHQALLCDFLDTSLSKTRKCTYAQKCSDYLVYRNLMIELNFWFEKVLDKVRVDSNFIWNWIPKPANHYLNADKDSIFSLWLSCIGRRKELVPDLSKSAIERLRGIFSISYELVKNTPAFHFNESASLTDLAVHFCKGNGYDVRFKNRSSLPACAMIIDGKKIVFVYKKLADRHKFRLILHEAGHLSLNHRAASELGLDFLQQDPHVRKIFASQEKEADLFAISCLFIMFPVWHFAEQDSSDDNTLRINSFKQPDSNLFDSVECCKRLCASFIYRDCSADNRLPKPKN